MEMVDEFQNDPDVYVFLISTLTGGVGLNLTAANKVSPSFIHLEPCETRPVEPSFSFFAGGHL
jgi:hypothetical protein